MPFSSPARVLVVDDHDDFRELAVAVLGREGLDVTSASNGPTALYAARLLSPALVVLDVVLPGLSGYSVVRQLRSDPELGPLAILVVSAVPPDLLEHALAVGADLTLQKPCSPDELSEAAARLLRLPVFGAASAQHP